ncbi:helix-turn-helix transcriptional regulator [Salinarimonas sp. NSM]|uniref:helix-turn-helix transcriptional regulator n=1 Tax=Salinarimonas sp. NSM TaxID=3458003 RepID=UPI0040369FBC
MTTIDAFEFTLKYRLPAHETDLDALVERLGEAGCTDALVGTGTAGRLALAFTREAAGATEALRTALADVRRAVPDAVLIEAQPDLVGLADAAEVLGMTRQNLRKLMLSHADFPLPVHEGTSSLWHLADLLGWFERARGDASRAGLRETAAATLEVNLAAQARRYITKRSEEIERLVG